MEYKFIRGCGLVGHVEDVVVDKSARGKSRERPSKPCILNRSSKPYLAVEISEKFKRYGFELTAAY